MRPVRAEIDRRERIECGVRLRATKDIRHATEDIAPIVKRHCLKIRSYRYARLKIKHHHRISANGNSEGIQEYRITFAIAEYALRHDCLPRAGFLITETAQRGGPPGKEAFANRQSQIGFADTRYPIAVAGVEKISEPQR